MDDSKLDNDPSPEQIAERASRRRVYRHVHETVMYATNSNENGDADGEQIAVEHAIKLLGQLMPEQEKGGGADAVELHGVPEVSRAAEDIPQAGAETEEGPREAHVVPVVQDGDPAPREVLSGKKPTSEAINPKTGIKARTFILYEMHGKKKTFVDKGTAAELANRNDLSASTVYRLAGKKSHAGDLWAVERVS